ncbi:MAG: restriction endonuclease [Burkholderiales bacterium]|nr:MAG: restriction endonuclease [Betaproteobacteria bacterium]TAG80419.1 MAG: restriction endonuclease [Burkholderiales bacterium]
MAIPKYDDLFSPLLEVFHKLGGSASVAEQEDEVASLLGLSQDEVAEIHRGSRTKLSYRLAWARNYLKHYGLINSSARSIWSLTSKGQATKSIDKATVKRTVHKGAKEVNDPEAIGSNLSPSDELLETDWEDELLDEVRSIDPAAFERLCQRILRESGFIHVTVTGRSGDGGIDGKGVVRIGGLLSFHVVFQCKRYQGSVSPSEIRDFRGAMVGRADKGLFITTGSFTKDARAEAQRDGAPPIDLIDGEALVSKLKELRIGVSITTKVVEEVAVDKSYFRGL